MIHLQAVNTSWSIKKTFVNSKKVPVISPLLFSGAYVTDYQQKANILIPVFAKQYTLVSGNSILPSKLTNMTEENSPKNLQ